MLMRNGENIMLNNLFTGLFDSAATTVISVPYFRYCFP